MWTGWASPLLRMNSHAASTTSGELRRDPSGYGQSAAAETNTLESFSGQLDWQRRYPPREVDTAWPATCGDRGEVDRLVAAAIAVLPSQRAQECHRWGMPLLLDWLADQPGDTWQQRWLASGADAGGEDRPPCT